jgi:glycosyltransferase involved in cell wall biosynthesis
MKILLVSMPSIHFTRWASQLKDSGHEVHWFDILNGGYNPNLEWVSQHTDWRYRGGNFRGRTFLKNRVPWIHKFIERDTAYKFNEVLTRVKPDAVHSFALHIAGYPILRIMQQRKNCKWIYSSWGSDLYYHQNINGEREKIEAVIPAIDFYFSDCKRDYTIIKKFNFNGIYLGKFPGGGGYDLEKLTSYCSEIESRKTILVKGYHNDFAKGLVALKAIVSCINKLKEYQIIVFAADKPLVEYFNKLPKHKKSNIKIYSRKEKIEHFDLMKLMGKSLISIGNNISDGIPNTLIETIIMGAYPIQSHSGGAVEELIDNNFNGSIINNPLDKVEIENAILKIINNKNLAKIAQEENKKRRNQFDIKLIKANVLKAYKKVEEHDFEIQ